MAGDTHGLHQVLLLMVERLEYRDYYTVHSAVELVPASLRIDTESSSCTLRHHPYRSFRRTREEIEIKTAEGGYAAFVSDGATPFANTICCKKDNIRTA
ncbi:hypothetical protein KC338_g77 [Hortaea werneckii]|nr:hypothetical protein KC338_g77 [Hortaea werneckii]